MTSPLRRATYAVVLLACLAGCGSGHSASTASSAQDSASTQTGSSAQSTSAQTSTTAQSNAAPCPAGQANCITTVPGVQVIGPADVTTNLRQAVEKNYKQLSDISVTCQQTTGFPKKCTMTAKWTLKGQPTVPVAGTVNAFGIYTGTHTYAFQLVYHQTGGPKLHAPPQSKKLTSPHVPSSKPSSKPHPESKKP
jgi:hypothetical protein